jgi:hypothetical protein
MRSGLRIVWLTVSIIIPKTYMKGNVITSKTGFNVESWLTALNKSCMDSMRFSSRRPGNQVLSEDQRLLA